LRTSFIVLALKAAAKLRAEEWQMHMFKLLAAIGALTFAAGSVSAVGVTEYTSLASWDSAVSNVSTYTFTGAPQQSGEFIGGGDLVFGPGTFTPESLNGYFYNDGLYGSGVEYISDDPPADGGNTGAALNVSFLASANVTALAFSIGEDRQIGTTVDVSVNGSVLAPVVLSSADMFFALADTSGPITSVTFTPPKSVGTDEMDVIGSYSTARAVRAPEIDPTSAASGIALLLGGLAVLRGSRRQSLTL
jgi:hypothetical protein